MVIAVRSPEEIEKLLELAKKYNLRKLHVDGIAITRFMRGGPKVDTTVGPVPEPPEDASVDPLSGKRGYYEMALGRAISDQELGLYPEVG